MKSAVNRTGLQANPPASAANSSPLSHIPLPRRKNSAKADKVLELDDTDSELSHDGIPTRSQAKMSLLSGTTFCCASGQKEDYIPEIKAIPGARASKKKPQIVAAKCDEASIPLNHSPSIPTGKGLLAKNRRFRPSQETAAEMEHRESVTNGVTPAQEDVRPRPSNHPADSRLRPPDDKRKLTPPSPQRRGLKEPGKKDQAEIRKYTEAMKKLRRDGNIPYVPVSKFTTPELNKKCNKQPASELVGVGLVDKSPGIVSSGKIQAGCLVGPPVELKPDCAVSPPTVQDTNVQVGVMSRSHESEDFDCPCCDRTSMLVDESGVLDTEINVFTSCDVVAGDSQQSQPDRSEKANAVQLELKTLKDDLLMERLKLQNQQNRVQHLEEELVMMEQLKNELEKEKELRKIAEDKLLEVLDCEKRMEVQKREKEKRMESKATQKDADDSSFKPLDSESNSPLLLGYESRIRRYQAYIAKLEKDNLTLFNELKKFKDLSPKSQEDHAKSLVEKLGQMERCDHQQQLQYTESFIDHVNNELFRTLLMQGRLEEECRVLHLRVEQLEQENGTLMGLIDEEHDLKTDEIKIDKDAVAEASNTKVQNKKPSHHQFTSTPSKKISQKTSISSEEKKPEAVKSSNTSVKSNSSEAKSPVSNPTSPNSKSGCASKIPSFGSSKPALVRKKSKPEILTPKSKSEIHSREVPSSSAVPNLKSPSSLPPSKGKLPHSNEVPKPSSVKRKRLSRNLSPMDKGVKDSKQRIKSSSIPWDQRRIAPEDLTPLCKKPDVQELSPSQGFPRQQQIWSFNCELQTEVALPEIKSKIGDSIDVFHDKLSDGEADVPEDDNLKQNLSISENSTTIDGINRTRDEGYSTMSSDLQPDSTADTTVSEPENSATYVVTEKGLRCGSDDSVTEFLDGSMCSSSDSGFGPLHQMNNSVFVVENSTEIEPEKHKELNPLDNYSRNHATVKHKEQIASVKPTIRTKPSSSDVPQNSPFPAVESHFIDKLRLPSDESKQSCTQTFLQDFDSLTSSKSKMDHYCKFDYASMVDYWNCSKEVFNLSNYGKTWHLGPKQSKYDDRVVFCSRNSYIDDNIFESEKIETAEKATLTEPEEELWREKALAPFIDESIWSLYSSESDIQVKHFPFEPLLSEPSLEKLITNCSPCIIVTKDINSDDSEASNSPEVNKFYEPKLDNTFNQKSEPFRPGLERVASDTVLYLKDAICELEQEMHRGLKSSKNISTLHNSGSESETSPVTGCRLKRDFIMKLESAMRDQDHLAWPSPSRSSSTSSLQSSTSCHVISDETDDVDMIRTSRKGSQDPDLSSASDAEYESLEHKDFVERWLQKEVAHNAPKSLVPQLEPVEEAVETTPPLLRRKASLPNKTNENTVRPRNRFMSYPTGASLQKTKFTTATPPPRNTQASASKSAPVSSESNIDSYSNVTDFAEDTEYQGVDSETKEFNGDFYKLCSVGSLRSLDRCSPAKKPEAQFKNPSDPSTFNKKPSSLSTTKLASSKPEKSKPTGLVKPTRPVTLTISPVPTVPEHSKPKSSVGVRRPTDFRVLANQNLPSKSNPDVLCKVNCDFAKSEARAKVNHSFQVPQKHILVVPPQCDAQTNITTENRARVDKTSPFSRLPALNSHSKEHSKSAKVKSPTRMVFKSSSSPIVSPSKSEAWLKRQQWKREQRIAARQNRLKEGCGTAWVHLQAKPELSDPTARSHLLDSLKAPTSSSGSSSTEEEEEDVLIIQTNSHLHKICRERRHKVKASANNPLFDMKKRTSIMGRRELFYRFGDKEREAIACFDFLEEIPSAASQETLTAPSPPHPEDLHPLQRLATPPSDLGSESLSSKERISFLSPTVDSRDSSNHPSSKTIDWSRSPFSSFRRLRLPNLWNQPLSHNMSSSTLSQDCEILDHISLSDSCAESYSSSTPESYEDAS